ncbi:NUDIX domain-containing protein [Patescibacteria group bacterium]|nr:NUDIX domain-containing protein [Patescibacteria group bacterium]
MQEPVYFKYCPQCRETIKNINRKDTMQYCTSCGWKFYFSTPQTAAVIVENEKQEILLVQRKNDPLKGKWSLPAGFVKYGEHPVSAALRELKEETRLSADYDYIVGQYIADDHPLTFSLLTVIKAKNIKGTPAPNDDAQAIPFFSATALPDMAFKSHVGALKLLRR